MTNDSPKVNQEIEKRVFPKEEFDAWARFLYKVYKRKKADGTLKIRKKAIE